MNEVWKVKVSIGVRIGVRVVDSLVVDVCLNKIKKNKPQAKDVIPNTNRTQG